MAQFDIECSKPLFKFPFSSLREPAVETAGATSYLYYPNCGALHRARFLSAGTGATAITGAASAISFDDHHRQSLEDCSGFVHRYTNGATDFLIGRYHTVLRLKGLKGRTGRVSWPDGERYRRAEFSQLA